jgi:hypothetical protein
MWELRCMMCFPMKCPQLQKRDFSASKIYYHWITTVHGTGHWLVPFQNNTNNEWSAILFLLFLSTPFSSPVLPFLSHTAHLPCVYMVCLRAHTEDWKPYIQEHRSSIYNNIAGVLLGFHFYSTHITTYYRKMHMRFITLLELNSNLRLFIEEPWAHCSISLHLS